MDLLFPHHECELAQARVTSHTEMAKYWLHNNLITINGQKMGKSLGNAITLEQLFNGMHPLLDQAYSPMTLRFFVLQAHYRSVLSFSNEALQAAQSGYIKLMNGLKILNELSYPADSDSGMKQDIDAQIKHSCYCCYAAMNDDFNTSQIVASLFSLLKYIHALKNGHLSPVLLGPKVLLNLKNTYTTFLQDILGLRQEASVSTTALLDILLALYSQAKAQKKYDQVDTIRAKLRALGIALQDTPLGVQWSYDHVV